MPSEEIFKNVRELGSNGFGVEGENPVDDMICTRLVGWVEIAGVQSPA